MPHWPKNKAYFWEQAPFFRLLIPLMGGIWLYDALWTKHLPVLFFILTALIAGIVLIFSGAGAIQSKVSKILFPIAVIVFLLSCAWLLYAANDMTQRKDYFGNYLNESKAQLAVVRSERATKATQRYELEVFGVFMPKHQAASGKALLYVYRQEGDSTYSVGDTLLVTSNWQAVANSGNPFSFSNTDFQRRSNIYLQQFSGKDAVYVVGRSTKQSLGMIAQIHQYCARQLQRFVLDPSAHGLLQAMLLGDESDFDSDLRQAYSQTGIIHIVSISGSHVAMMFVLVSSLLFWLRGKQATWIKYVLGLAVVWLYVLVAGAPPSAVRSAVMFSFVALGVVSGREGQALNTLFAAAFILLVGQPQWLFAIGFQLSFLAVFSILLFYKPLYRLWPQSNRLSRLLWQSICVSLAAEILIAPLVVYYFHSFPLMFLLANLLATAALGILTLFGGVAIIALSWWSWMASLLGHLLGILVAYFNQVILYFQKLSPAALSYLQITLLEMLCLYSIILAASIWLLLRRRRAVLYVLSFLAIFIGSLSYHKLAAWRQERLVVYNNGRQANIERQYGGYYTLLVPMLETDYNTKAGHTGYYTWRAKSDTLSEYFVLAGKRILLLRDTTRNSFSGTLPVDILLVARPSRKLDKVSLIRSCQPKIIVLAQRLSDYQLKSWQQSCADARVSLHYVVKDGAYILQ